MIDRDRSSMDLGIVEAEFRSQSVKSASCSKSSNASLNSSSCIIDNCSTCDRISIGKIPIRRPNGGDSCRSIAILNTTSILVIVPWRWIQSPIDIIPKPWRSPQI
jgi:hypothetical protein